MSYVNLEIASIFGQPPKTYNGQPVKFQGSFHEDELPKGLLPGVDFLYPNNLGYVYIDELGIQRDRYFDKAWLPNELSEASCIKNYEKLRNGNE